MSKHPVTVRVERIPHRAAVTRMRQAYQVIVEEMRQQQESLQQKHSSDQEVEP